jgi:hypothetical protein
MADNNGAPFNKVQGSLDDLQRSLTVAHIKDAMPKTAPIQSGSTETGSSSGSQTQSSDNK